MAYGARGVPAINQFERSDCDHRWISNVCGVCVRGTVRRTYCVGGSALSFCSRILIHRTTRYLVNLDLGLVSNHYDLNFRTWCAVQLKPFPSVVDTCL